MSDASFWDREARNAVSARASSEAARQGALAKLEAAKRRVLAEAEGKPVSEQDMQLTGGADFGTSAGSFNKESLRDIAVRALGRHAIGAAIRRRQIGAMIDRYRSARC